MNLPSEQDFEHEVQQQFEKNRFTPTEPLVIAFIGNVSTGKSSLINALFERDRGNLIAEVGAVSGVTTQVKQFNLDDEVIIVDSPGLSDIREENSKVTAKLIPSIDIAVFVVSGSTDRGQRYHYEDVRSQVPFTLFVLNKIDEFDDLEESALQEVIEQWKMAIGVTQVFPTCAKGYDPKSRQDRPLDIRGVDALRDAIMTSAKDKKKNLQLQRQMKKKRNYAIGIGVGAVIAAVTASFAPGSTVYITGIQMAALANLNYLYKGKVLNMQQTASIMLPLVGQNIGKNLFMFVSSFLPGVDVAGAAVAGLVTIALMVAAIYALEKGYDLNDGVSLAGNYHKIYQSLKGMNLDMEEMKKSGFLDNLFDKLFSSMK